MYTVICDRCGADAFAESEFSCWGDVDTAIDFAVDNSAYVVIDGKHYCPDCWTWNDEDELIAKP